MSNDQQEQDAAAAALHATDEARTTNIESTASETTAPNAFSDTAAALGLAVAPVTPPDALRARLMAQIAVTPQAVTPQAVTPQTVTPQLTATVQAENQSDPLETVDPLAPNAPSTSDTSRGPGPAERRAARRWAPIITGVVAAAAAVAIFFGGVALGGAGQNAPATPLAEQAQELVNISASADAQRTVVELDGGGNATLLWSGRLAQSALFVDGLPSLSAEQSYQLWYIGDDGAVSAGLLEPGAEGPSWRVLDGEMSSGDTVGVTVEPAGGSEQPTSDPVLAIQS